MNMLERKTYIHVQLHRETSVCAEASKDKVCGEVSAHAMLRCFNAFIAALHHQG